jgi:hypothetical protein
MYGDEEEKDHSTPVKLKARPSSSSIPHIVSPTRHTAPVKVRAHTGVSGGNFGSPQGKQPQGKVAARLPNSELYQSPSYEQQLAITRAQARAMLAHPIAARRPDVRSISRSASSPVILAGGSKYLSIASPGYKTALAPIHIIQAQAKHTTAASPSHAIGQQ